MDAQLERLGGVIGGHWGSHETRQERRKGGMKLVAYRTRQKCWAMTP